MVDRFNGRISEVLATTRFDSAQSLEDTLSRYVRLYNHQIPQRALGHLSPVQALKDWQEMRPELFKKKVYNHTGLDTLLMLNNFWRNSMGRRQSEIQVIIITTEAPPALVALGCRYCVFSS
jgi:hypothetical protein